MAASQEVCPKYSAASWHPPPLARDSVLAAWKRKIFWEIAGFSGELKIPSSLLLFYTAILLNTSLKTLQPPDCATGAFLACFATSQTHLDLYTDTITSNNRGFISASCVHIMCASESLVVLELPYYLCSSFMLHWNRILLKTPKVRAFQNIYFQKI